MRKTGENTKIEVEVGTTFYAMSQLTSVASPAASVNKKFATGVTFLSDRKTLQPVVRLDGVISGGVLTPGSENNSIDVSALSVYISGVLVSIAAVTETGFLRSTTIGEVVVVAVTVDANGNINKTHGSQGASSSVRGAAGGPPFLPLNQVLIGYITMTYYDGSDSGEDVIEASEVDSESKERSILPSYKIHYYDGSGDNPTNAGAIEFASVLPTIHAVTGAGPGTACRKVYSSFYEPVFEQLPDAKDFNFDEMIGTVKSKAYQDTAEEVSTMTPSWSGAGSAYFSKVDDVLNTIKNTKRWIKMYPDADEIPYWAGRAIVKVSRTMPNEDNISASISLEGSGELYPITS